VFVAYVTAGYPSPAATVSVLLGLQRGGVDVIELGTVLWRARVAAHARPPDWRRPRGVVCAIGTPFSDPLADGPAIQAANQVSR
jgi:tryptophan synthase